MNRKICMALICLVMASYCGAQQFYLPKFSAADSTGVAKQMSVLATAVLSKYKDTVDRKAYLGDLYKLQILASKNAQATETIASLRAVSQGDDPGAGNLLFIQHELFALARYDAAANKIDFKTAFTGRFRKLFGRLDDKSSLGISTAFITRNGVDELENNFKNALAVAQQKDSIDGVTALDLCRDYYLFSLYRIIEPTAKPLIDEDYHRRYAIKYELITTKSGAHIEVVVILKKGVELPQPVVLQYTIYADSIDMNRMIEPAARGYAAVTAYTRGKGISPDRIVPFEDDGKDANDVIDWISKQPWCNGKIGMFGGSYNGFTQWAAAKYHHPALKTIVPYVAAIPGLGLPMENNIFLLVNYGWAFYTTDNNYLDNDIYNDPKRWRSLNFNWYDSGAAYDKVDSVDGKPNPWFQRWLKHPDYDRYWQNQVPYQSDYAKINIPVLTFEGYYDDGQVSGLHYYLEHLKYNPHANHYLIIGPYDHFGTQKGGNPVVNDYAVDPIALISTRDITFQWMDYILKGAKKPALLKNKVNYEVMGANVWKHAPSIAKMANKMLKLYLTNTKMGDNYSLSAARPIKPGSLGQVVDLADRKTSNNDYYPSPIIKQQLDHSNGLFFISKPFDKPVSVNGMISGVLKASINKKDMDVGIVFYEVTPDGRYFELTYFLGRASYARDMSKRALLHPGRVETIPFWRTRMVSRQMSKGSRLLVVLNINKNPFAEINYGTGGDIEKESIQDGKVPLRIKWCNDSFVRVPVWVGE